MLLVDSSAFFFALFKSSSAFFSSFSRWAFASCNKKHQQTILSPIVGSKINYENISLTTISIAYNVHAWKNNAIAVLVTILDLSLLHHRLSIPDFHFLNIKEIFKDSKNSRVFKMRTTSADKPTFILFSTSLHFSVADAIVSFAFVISSCCSSAKKIGTIQILILLWITPAL